jgi:hypothetical protein
MLQLQNLIAKVRVQMAVRYVSDRHKVKHAFVLLDLVAFKPFNCKHAPVYSYEVAQLFKVFDRPFALLYRPFKLHNRLLLALL